MSEFRLDNMSPLQMDVLREIGNIGAGNAATALAKLIEKKVDMSVPVVSLCDFDELTEFVGGPETVMLAILLGIQGDVDGMMMFLFDRDSASRLVEMFMKSKRNPEDEFNEIECSALNEMGNIISGAYLTSLSMFTNLNMISTVPMLNIDMVGALLSIPAIEYGKVGDQVLFIETKFEGTDHLNGYFLLIPDMVSYEKILNALGV